MADLSHKNSAQVVKVVGADSNGVETNYQKIEDNGHALIEVGREHKDALHNIFFVTPITIWENSLRFSKQSNRWDESLTGGATSTHVPEYSSVKLSVGTASGDLAIRQTYRHFHYIKGNSQRVMLTGNFSGVKAGVRKRYGQFNAYNGVFFESNGTAMYVVKRSDTSGVVVDTAIASTAWNVDRLDGSGGEFNPSGATADPTKEQLFFIDYTWLGAGIIRWGIFIGEEPIIIHIEEHSNTLGTPWSRSAELPIRCEIENLTAQASGSDFYQGCSTIKSMGGNLPEGEARVVSTGVNAISVSTTPKVCAGIRLNSTAVRGAGIKPLDFSIIPASGNNIIYYQVILRATLTGATWAANTDIADVLTNNPTYTGGVVLDAGYIDLTGNVGESGTQNVINDRLLGYSIAGVGDSLILVVQTVSGNGSVLFTGKWQEFT